MTEAESEDDDDGETVELIETVGDTDALHGADRDAIDETVALCVERAEEDTVSVIDPLGLPETELQAVLDEYIDAVLNADCVVHVVAVEQDEADADEHTEGVVSPYVGVIVTETDTLAQPEVVWLMLVVTETLTVTLCEDDVTGEGVVDDEDVSVEVDVVQRVVLDDKVDEIEAVPVTLEVDDVESDGSFVCVPDADSEELCVAEDESVVVSEIETVVDPDGDKVTLTQLLIVRDRENVEHADALPVEEADFADDNDSAADRECECVGVTVLVTEIENETDDVMVADTVTEIDEVVDVEADNVPDLDAVAHAVPVGLFVSDVDDDCAAEKLPVEEYDEDIVAEGVNDAAVEPEPEEDGVTL